MKCDNCMAETTWLESIGSEFICHKCISKHQVLGLVLRTSADSFKFVMKKIKPNNYSEMMAITPDQIKAVVNVKSFR
jgi:hypothetical protein